MSLKEKIRLVRLFRESKKNSWSWTPNLVSGRRSVKNRAKHVGFVLRDSRVKSEVFLDEV